MGCERSEHLAPGCTCPGNTVDAIAQWIEGRIGTRDEVAPRVEQHAADAGRLWRVQAGADQGHWQDVLDHEGPAGVVEALRAPERLASGVGGDCEPAEGGQTPWVEVADRIAACVLGQCPAAERIGLQAQRVWLEIAFRRGGVGSKVVVVPPRVCVEVLTGQSQGNVDAGGALDTSRPGVVVFG